VRGYLFTDTQGEIINVEARITYFTGPGRDVVGATSQHQLSGNYAASTLVNELKSGRVFTKVRLRLFRNGTLVHTKDISP